MAPRKDMGWEKLFERAYLNVEKICRRHVKEKLIPKRAQSDCVVKNFNHVRDIMRNFPGYDDVEGDRAVQNMFDKLRAKRAKRR